MSRAYQGHGTRQTPQSQPIPGKDQVANSAGGYSFQADKWTRLDRFIVLGSEGGTYYIGERPLTAQNAASLSECLAEDGPRTVARIVEISTSGRAAKNSPAIFALAIACASTDEKTKRAALDAIPAVCRTGTHLFEFGSLVGEFRGWGRGLRRGIGAWYKQDPQKLAYQVVKYRQREGWTHRDMLRKVHTEPPTPTHKLIYDWVAHGTDPEGVELPAAIEAYVQAQASSSPKETVALVQKYGGALPREALNPEHMTEEVWTALLEAGMPMTALIRNLANLTRKGVVKGMDSNTQLVCDQITDGERLRKARVHPYAILLALATYASGGHSGMSRGEPYAPVSAIMDALDSAFYAAFDNVTPTGKRTMLGLDVSGSMSQPILGSYDTRKNVMKGVPLMARDGAAAMAMVAARTEPVNMTVAFASGGWTASNKLYGRAGIAPFDLSGHRLLRDVISATQRLPFGGTDCALPMLFALDQGINVDTFVVYTDSETWSGGIHPSQALQQYREKTGIAAKLVCVGMCSNGFTIADPSDAGMMDVVGFDTAAPQVISDFS